MLIRFLLSSSCRFSAVCAVSFGLLSSATGAENDSLSPKQIAALLQKLDAKSRQERLAAETELLKLGPAILDSLPHPDLLPSVAVREAVRRLRVRLERTAAEQSIQASRVALTGERTIRELVAAIAEQTWNNVVCAAAAQNSATSDAFKQKLAVDWNDEPFWMAIGQIEAAGFRAEYRLDGNSLTLVPAATSSKPTGRRTRIQKAFLVEALPVEQILIEGTDNVLVRVPLRILCEPRLRPLFLRCSMSDWSLSAGTRKLSPFSPASRIEVPLGDGGREAKVELSFLASSADAQNENLTLSGQLTLLTAALEREVTFPTLAEAEGLTRRRGGVTVTINKAQLDMPHADNHSARINTQIGYDSGAKALNRTRPGSSTIVSSFAI